MRDDLELKVKITPEVAAIPGNIKSTSEKIGKEGGFTGELGSNRRNKVSGLLGSIEELINKGELSKDEIKQLNLYTKEIYEILGKAAATTKNISEEMKKALAYQEKRLGKLTEVRGKRDDLIEQGKVDLDSGKFLNVKGFNEMLAEIGVYKRTKDGGISKNSFVDFETINKNMKAGKAQYVTKDGTPLEENEQWKSMVADLEEKTRSFKDLTKQIKICTEKLEAANRKVENIAKVEELTGANINTIPATTGKMAQQDQNAIANLRQDASMAYGERSTNPSSLYTQLGDLKQKTGMAKALKQLSLYTLAWKSLKKALREAKSTITELDKYLTEQAMVTGKTRKETYALLQSYQDMAKTLGTTTREVAEVATQFMRQGKTVEDSLVLTNAAVSAAKVAGIQATQSVDYLTTALNGFRLSAQEAMSVSDKFASVAASAAVSYEEVAIALSKVASQSNLAGMSIDYTTALLTKGIETSREAPETIGTALKTIIARMRELSDYGKTLDGESDVNNVESQLAYVDIALTDVNGELRSTEDVLNELGKKWDTLNSNQQAAIAKALAGTR